MSAEAEVRDVLAVVEQREGSLRGVSGQVVSLAARLATELGGQAHALALGGPGFAAGAASLGRNGAARVRVAEHEALAGYHPEGYTDVVAEVVGQGAYALVVLAATSQGKDLAPRVAACLGIPLASEVTGVETEGGVLAVRRPIYAGKAFARISITASSAVVTVRPNTFSATERPADGAVDVFSPELDPAAWRTRVVGFEPAGGDLDVAEASVVVAGGRGMKDPSNWTLLEDLRDALGGDVAALGASRAVVDAGWRPHGEQVGQTGKTVSPKLYVAVGISGAIQHLAGMRTSGTIVAVNKDPDAPIFATADYGVVGDLFEVVPKLTEEIRRLKAGA